MIEFIIVIILSAIVGALIGLPTRKKHHNMRDKYIENFFSEENIKNYLENFFDPIVRDYLILKKHNPSVITQAMRFKKVNWDNSRYCCLVDCDKVHLVFSAYSQWHLELNNVSKRVEAAKFYYCLLYEFITGKSYKECPEDFKNTEAYKTFSLYIDYQSVNSNSKSDELFPIHKYSDVTFEGRDIAKHFFLTSKMMIDSPSEQFTIEKYKEAVGGPLFNSKLVEQNYVPWKNNIESLILDDLAELLKERYATKYPNLIINRNGNEITFYCP